MSPLTRRPRAGAKAVQVAVGGVPVVDLLPPEVRAERRAGVAVRRTWMGVAAAAAVVAIGVGAATASQITAQGDLEAAQAETQQLLVEQGRYTEVRDVQADIDRLTAAQVVGGSTEIVWRDFLTDLQGTLPAGVSVTTITLDQASPVEDYAQADSPLQGARVGTLTFTAESATLPSLPEWLDGLATLPGYTDATPGTVSLEEGVYDATVTMHIDQRAFSGRYTKEDAS
ncbi:hypothetical protein [Frigoribacterium salinisoli]